MWSIDTDGDFPPRFMNSSVAALAECLLLYRDSIGRTTLGPSPEPKTVRFLGVTYDVTPPPPQDADAIRSELSRLRREIGQADPPALGNAETWWSVLLEDEESQYT